MNVKADVQALYAIPSIRHLMTIFTLLGSMYTFSGPLVKPVVTAYAQQVFDGMLAEKGITKESIKAIQDKLAEVDRQTDSIKTLAGSVAQLVQDNAAVKSALVNDNEEKKTTRDQIQYIYNYLLTGRPHAP